MPNAIVNIWFGKLKSNLLTSDIGHASMWIGPNSDPYISWWPNGSIAKRNTYPEDEQAEGSSPHRSYHLEHLDEQKMHAEWNVIRHAASLDPAHYRLHSKNCATVVWRILKAGGAKDYLNCWETRWLLWTPVRLNDVCKALVKKGHGIEVEHTHRPQVWLPVIG